ncbi:MAG: NIF family HAD-type phosphatase [Thermoguttaceae bacterium]
MPGNDCFPLLILDLDETLIYGAEREGTRPCDFRIGPFHVYTRPYLDDFLSGVGRHFCLAIWSSASSDYVAGIAQRILPAGLEWVFVWSRERCIAKRNLETFETEYVKDLKKAKRAGFDLAQVLIVDDTRHKVARNYGNAIYIAPFEGDPADAELPLLLEYLKSLLGCPSFRAIEKRGWRSRIVQSADHQDGR